MHAIRLQKDNTKLAGLLEEALDCIDQYDYEEAFDLVHRIKDALNHSRMSHPPVIPWGGFSLTEMEELLQKVQQLETENAALRRLIDDPEAMHSHYLRVGNGFEVWRAERVRGLERDNESLIENVRGLEPMVDRLERDNAVLRKALYAQANYQRELRADRDRLDWLDKNSMHLSVLSSPDQGGVRIIGNLRINDSTTNAFRYVNVFEPSIRATIDAARKEAQP